MNDEAINKFGQSLRGELIGRNHTEYDEARKLYNGMIDKRPLLIARCADVADVIASLNFGRDSKVPIAIRGGGHNGPGLGSVNDGLVIDLSMIKGVRVDPAALTARVGAGCTQGDLDHAAHAFGLAVPAGIISTTGIAGLTLSGGHGYLSRKYGLTIDNLLEADVVLADGSFLVASKDKNPTSSGPSEAAAAISASLQAFFSSSTPWAWFSPARSPGIRSMLKPSSSTIAISCRVRRRSSAPSWG